MPKVWLLKALADSSFGPSDFLRHSSFVICASAVFSSTPRSSCPKNYAVRTCVIFNPTARGEKAKRFRRHLDDLGSSCALKMTAAVGDARRLATEAVAKGFEIIVA